MCGIAGVVRRDGRKVSRNALANASQLLQARGPDASGEWISRQESVALIHRRLSIIDLDARSNQPFSDETGRFHLVYNGEIYNFRQIRDSLVGLGYQFGTTSDTEVLLRALMHWGTAAIPRFNGMFAFALWDNDEQTLLLGRDRFGVKPLYVCHEPNGDLIFASTLAPLMTLAERVFEIDGKALASYLQGLYIPRNKSAIRGMSPLAPGSHAILREGNLRVDQWWVPSEPCVQDVSGTSFLKQLEADLAEAVTRRLVSDVPLGVWLSGGLDSSLIASFMVESAAAKVRSFTIKFEESKHDESRQARVVAERLGTEHVELVATPSALLEFATNHASFFDEPFADASSLPTLLLSFLTAKHVTVVLCGDGGDELFGGYHYYSLARTFDTMSRFPWRLRKAYDG